MFNSLSRKRIEKMPKTKIMALVQLCAVVLIIGYSTYHLFSGHLEQSLSTLPLLLGYYVFVTARSKKKKSGEEQDENDSK